MYNFLFPFLVSGALFTFDDGPSISHTSHILNTLKKYKIHAVFCIRADALHNRKKIALARRAIKEGHLICNHSYSHPNFAKLTPRAINRQLRISQWLIKSKLGVTPTLFRPPFGVHTRYTRLALKKHRLKLFMWDVDSKDWQTRTTPISLYKTVTRLWRYRRARKRKSILLFHDTSWKTSVALERIILRIKP
jgi:peptidoglycan/xylan/chitin deacetylase (PgdA/CDA1 family)